MCMAARYSCVSAGAHHTNPVAWCDALPYTHLYSPKMRKEIANVVIAHDGYGFATAGAGSINFFVPLVADVPLRDNACSWCKHACVTALHIGCRVVDMIARVCNGDF